MAHQQPTDAQLEAIRAYWSDIETEEWPMATRGIVHEGARDVAILFAEIDRLRELLKEPDWQPWTGASGDTR